MSWRVLLQALVGSLWAGCVPDTAIPGDVTIACRTDADCPEERTCVRSLCLGAGSPCVDTAGGQVVPLEDGASCQLADGSAGVCLAALCTTEECGDGNTTPSEECDDANAVDGDGCDEGCVITRCGNGVAAGAEECDDGNVVEGDDCDSNCTPPRCANGIHDPFEGCDDGDTADGDGCDSNCTVTACGNGVLTDGEACDDGNPTNGDGCDETCAQTECGNGVITPGEVCDDDNDNDGDGCDSNCTETGCGNGVRTLGEDCDDANLIDGDGCDSNCAVTGCGNAVVSPGEICDDGNQIGDDGCDANCRPTGCGNGAQTTGEVCDDGNLIDGDGCDSNCTPTACGNGVATIGEVCDDGDVDDGDGCDANCRPTGCGNGRVTAGEGCDDGDLDDGDGCDSNCRPTGCGNEIVTTGELCDDGDLVNGDGCDQNCTPSGCGNGIQSAGEGCDDGNGNNNDNCPDGVGGTCQNAVCNDGFVDAAQPGLEACDDGVPGGGTCNDACVVVGCGNSVVDPGEDCDTGLAPPCDPNCRTPGCGNAFVGTDELCDDGNLISADGCDSTCRPTGCGSGVPTGSEECDDGNQVNGDGCDVNCTVSRCGNGVIDIGDEACDDGNTDECVGTCNADCTAGVDIFGCGDGIVCGVEECDEGALNQQNLPDHCRATCVLPACGDQIVDGDEICDDGNSVEPVIMPAPGKLVPDYCTNDCGTSFGACADGVLDEVEDCDDGNLVQSDGCNALCVVEAGFGCHGGGPASCALALFVDAARPVNGTGTTDWGDAFRSLQDALAAAPLGREIWVNRGTYRPDFGAGLTPGNRNLKFAFPPNRPLFGGFADNYNSAHRTFETVLDGDLLGDDVGTANQSDNSITVGEVVNNLGTWIIDGVTFRGGTTHGMNAGSNAFSTVLRNITARENRTGVRMLASGARIEDSLTELNIDDGLHVQAFVSAVRLTARDRITIAAGTLASSSIGAGLVKSQGQVATVINSIVTGGQIVQANTGNNLRLTQVTIVQSSSPTVRNFGGDMTFNGVVTIAPGTFLQNSGGGFVTGSFSCPFSAASFPGSVPAPCGVAPITGVPLAGAAVINAGDTVLPLDTADVDGDGDTGEALPLDLAGQPRVVGGRIDMGAFELP